MAMTWRGVKGRLWLARRRRALRRVPPTNHTPFDTFILDGYQAVLEAGLNLDHESLVVDVGAYRGDFIASMRKRYDCQVVGVEPVPEFLAALYRRFKGDGRVRILPYAIGREAGQSSLHLSGDATGVGAEGVSVPIRLESVESFCLDVPDEVDLLAINIEGAEYALIPLLSESGMLFRVNLVYVQFHRSVPGYAQERAACQEILSRTHELVWSYEYVWEAWRRKVSPTGREH